MSYGPGEDQAAARAIDAARQRQAERSREDHYDGSEPLTCGLCNGQGCPGCKNGGREWPRDVATKEHFTCEGEGCSGCWYTGRVAA